MLLNVLVNVSNVLLESVLTISSIVARANVFQTARLESCFVYHLFSNLGEANAFNISASGCFLAFGQADPILYFCHPCNMDQTNNLRQTCTNMQNICIAEW